jgi:hypothetical protein
MGPPEEQDEQVEPYGRSYVLLVLRTWAVLIMLLCPFIATDGFYTEKKIHLSQMVEDSDYTTTFYASGKLVLAHRLQDIYPPSQAQTLAKTAYDRLAHEYLPYMPKSKIAVCPYFPLAPLLFSPLTVLPPAFALLTWQILSLVALLVSCTLIDRMRTEKGIATLWLAFLFVPVIHCLFVGQSAILLGLLPLTAGFYCLTKGKPLAAGMIWSLTFLKPQFLLVAGFICLCLLLRKNFRALAGLAAGTGALCMLNLLIFGADSFSLWLGGLHVQEVVYSSASNGVMQSIVASLPRLIILATPVSSHSTVKAILCVFAVVLVAAGLVAARSMAKSPLSQNAFDVAVLLLAVTLLPLISPYLFFYDLSVFLLFGVGATSSRKSLRPIILLAALMTNYRLIALIPGVPNLGMPWLLLLVYLEMYRRLLMTAFKDSRGTNCGDS